MSQVGALPPGADDAAWWSHAQRQYEDHWRRFAGGPDTFADGAHGFYLSSEFGVAALMYQKAIDVLHTLYCISGLDQRQPSAKDMAITDGYLNSVGASLSLHPGAPMGDSVAEVAHRLEDVRVACKSAGLPVDPYRTALKRLAPYARRFGIFVNTAVLKDPAPLINQGIMAGGDVTVTNSAIAVGFGAHAARSGGQGQTPDTQLTALLDEFIRELARSRHPDRNDLTELAEEARQELAAPTPRIPRLKALASGLAVAVGGITSLATLAAQIEAAIRGL